MMLQLYQIFDYQSIEWFDSDYSLSC